MRTTFQRHLSIAPRDYRRRFSTSSTNGKVWRPALWHVCARHEIPDRRPAGCQSDPLPAYDRACVQPPRSMSAIVTAFERRPIGRCACCTLGVRSGLRNPSHNFCREHVQQVMCRVAIHPATDRGKSRWYFGVHKHSPRRRSHPRAECTCSSSSEATSLTDTQIRVFLC